MAATLTNSKRINVNKFNPKKLLNSKLTAVTPENKERHFMVTKVEFEEEGELVSCVIEALMSKRESVIKHHDLKDNKRWLQGWK
jgi:tryptophan-rich hypothetical protein